MSVRGRLPLLVGTAIAFGVVLLAAPLALAHSTRITVPPEDLSVWSAIAEFSKYGVKHILLGYDHLLFLGGLALLSAGLRDVLAIVAIFAVSYSATLIGGTLLEVALPGDLVDSIIALSVGLVGLQIAFGAPGRRLSRNPRLPAAAFGLAHGLGLSSLLQELQLPGDDVLPSVIGFNLGVEVGQILAIALFVATLSVLRAFPFPSRERIPAGFALVAAGSVFLSFVAFGVTL